MYAIANGGWFGVGLGEGRTKWGWLPNGHNDFIFAVIAEELGVVGCSVVLALFGVLAYTGLRIARRVSHPFRRLVAAGLTALIAGQATINLAGVVGLVPVTGLPLPLISDGGSALVVTLAMIGMLASFARAEPAAARALHARPPGKLARLLWAPLPPMPRYIGGSGVAGSARAARGCATKGVPTMAELRSVVLAGGGTGGHIYPLLAFAECLRRHSPDLRITCVGSGKGLEGQLIPAAGYDLRQVPAYQLPRSVNRSTWPGRRPACCAR